METHESSTRQDASSYQCAQPLLCGGIERAQPHCSSISIENRPEASYVLSWPTQQVDDVDLCWKDFIRHCLLEKTYKCPTSRQLYHRQPSRTLASAQPAAPTLLHKKQRLGGRIIGLHLGKGSLQDYTCIASCRPMIFDKLLERKSTSGCLGKPISQD
jgi:hypothetical protein